jgi:hypothetical protein
MDRGSSQKGTHSARLLSAALALALVTAVFHLYIGLAIYGLPLGVPLILIGLVYIGGTGMIAANFHRGLWLKVGPGWVVLVITLWALSAAVNAPNTRNPIAYLDKAIEAMLLVFLFLMRRGSVFPKKESTSAS